MSLFEAEFEMPGASYEWEFPGELGGPAHETYETFGGGELELELANELLEITTEAELEEFLGKLVRSVGKAASGFIRSPIGKALGGVLKNVAKTALPMVGSALGTFVAPGVGTAIGGSLGSWASKLLEVQELEAMGEAEAELEAARRYVQWARGTTRNAMRAPAGLNPQAAVRAAAVTSARRHAPALLRKSGAPGFRARRPPRYGTPTPGARPPFDNGTGDIWAGAGDAPSSADDMWDTDNPGSGDASGSWVRRGSQIVLFNV